ncbi:DNA polymerase III subunit delta [Bacillus cihuensis]|uniref:DNA polymerase III subunit delta n=1 Tax=Bacillus cihuensis TaxID=1208599 RepID=UPI0004117C04|nr:DNA polymerase III subunit delta [Bacillus cihuensis]
MKTVHVLFGNEPYLIEEKKNTIIKSVLAEEEMEFGVSSHVMRETPVQMAIEDAQTLSFLGGKRVVIIKDCYFLTGEKAKQKIEHDLDVLIRYIERPNEDSIVILTVSNEKLDSRKKVVKSLKKSADLHEAKPLPESKLVDWIHNKAKDLNSEISKDAVHHLISFIGSNLLKLEQELRKMAAYTAGHSTITKTVVEELISRTLEQDIFNLIDRIVHKDMHQAFDILGDMFRQGEDPIKILNLLSRQFRIIFQVMQMSKNNKKPSQLATTLKLHPYVVTIAKEQGQEYDTNQLTYILSQLSKLDYEMKTGKVDKHLSLETFIAKLA